MPIRVSEFDFVKQTDCTGARDFLVARLAGADGTRTAAVDPRALFETARLNRTLLDIPTDPAQMPEGCAALAPSIDALRVRTMATNSRTLAVSREVGEILARAGIDHLHFKGPLQQVALYGHIHRKLSADLDVLVRPRDRAAAQDALAAAGYRVPGGREYGWWVRFLNEVHLRTPDDETIVDLHHGIGQPGLPRPRNTAAFFDRRTTITYREHSYEVLGRIDRCLVSAVSLTKAFLAREPALSNLADLNAALSALDGAQARQLEAIARTSHLAGSLAFACRASGLVFSAPAACPQPARTPFPELSDETLLDMLTMPWLPDLPWPRRRVILRELGGANPLAYLRDGANALLSELVHRHLARPDRPAQEARR